MATKINTTSPGLPSNQAWTFLNKFPKGNVLFSKLASFLIPYTGSIKPIVVTLENGYAAVRLADRRSVRNHLKSIHAIALANLGEFTTGLSLIPQLGTNAKAILVKIEVVYLKKARGTLLADASANIGKLQIGDSQHVITANIKNETGELVCQVFATWQVRVTNTF